MALSWRIEPAETLRVRSTAQPVSGTYVLAYLSGDGDMDTVWVGCPMCGERLSLAGTAIAADGRVSPIQDCPDAACVFRSHLHLQGWGG